MSTKPNQQAPFSRVMSLASAIVILLSGCSRADVRRDPIAPAPPTVSNTAPSPNAGLRVGMVLPQNSFTLTGRVVDVENNVASHLWRKVSGPPSFVIANPASLTTLVSNLEKGTYAFELSATDGPGLTGKDTISVMVVEPPPPGPGQFIISEFEWGCPMGCSLLITCLPCYVPAGASFTVWVRPQNAAAWIQALPAATTLQADRYYYRVANNELELSSTYSTNEEWPRNMQVRIMY